MDVTGFDRVVILDGDAPAVHMNRHQFEHMAIRDRVRLLLAGSVRFYKDDLEIPPRQALKG